MKGEGRGVQMFAGCTRVNLLSYPGSSTSLALDLHLLPALHTLPGGLAHTSYPPRPVQIVMDLRTLRTLASYLLRFDAVTYLVYLDNLRATEGTKSVWLFHSAAHTIFEAAKGRVFKTKKGAAAPPGRKRKQPSAGGGGGAGEGGGDQSSSAAPADPPASVTVLDATLELLPKWVLLAEVLAEVQLERAKMLNMTEPSQQAQCEGEGQHDEVGKGGLEDILVDLQDSDTVEEGIKDGEQARAGAGVGAGAGVPAASHASTLSDAQRQVLRDAAEAPVLVACQDTFTCLQLRRVLGPGGASGLMHQLFAEYLQRKLEVGTRGKARNAASVGEGEEGPGDVAGSSGRMMGGYRLAEEQALLREARTLAKQQGCEGSGGSGRGDAGGSSKLRQGGRGRGGRGAWRGDLEGGGRGRGPHGRAGVAAAAASAAAEAAVSATGALMHEPGAAVGEGGGGWGSPAHPAGRASGVEGVRFMALESHDIMRLWELQPAFVVMYDPDVTLTRQLEVYRASRRGRPLRVYLLRYEDSMEMDRWGWAGSTCCAMRKAW